jgi:hypothetical protein
VDTDAETSLLAHLATYRIDAPAAVPSFLIESGPVVPYETGAGSKQAFSVPTAHCRVILHKPHVSYMTVQGWLVVAQIRTRSSIWNAATNDTIPNDQAAEYEWEDAYMMAFPEQLSHFKSDNDEHAVTKACAILRRMVQHMRRIKRAGLSLYLECGGDFSQNEDLRITADALERAEQAMADRHQAPYDQTADGAERSVRVLILACSDTKRQDKGQVPAVELYNGPAFKVLRKSGSADIVLILSAKYGLIPADTPIAAYDTCMDAARAVELSTDPQALRDAAETIAAATAGRQVSEIHFFGGKLYRNVVLEYSRAGLLPAEFTWDSRDIGYKLKTLKEWLERSTSPVPGAMVDDRPPHR